MAQVPRATVEFVQLHLVATLEGAHLVLRMADGARHSEIPIIAEDPLDSLARYEATAMQRASRPPARPLWSLDQLDTALRRQGYERTAPWREGPSAEITRHD